MATRKSGDSSRGPSSRGPGSSDADETDAGASPGSYVKVNSSRRKKRKRGRSVPPSVPPAGGVASLAGESSEAAFDDVVDTEGEDTTDDRGRRTAPEWGVDPARPEDQHAVDDLRRRSSSSRALHRSHGPLGMDDTRSDPSRDVGDSREQRLSPLPPSRTPSGRMNVVEINPPTSDNTNGSYGDEDPSSYELAELGREGAGEPGGLFDEDELRELAAERLREERYLSALERDPLLRSARPEPRYRDDALRYGGRDDDEDIDRIIEARLAESAEPRHSLSSVLGARASLRPSPPPPPDKTSLLWWLIVLALTGIIVTAGVIAVGEAKRKGLSEPVAAPTREAPVAPPASPAEPGTAAPGPAAEAKIGRAHV